MQDEGYNMVVTTPDGTTFTINTNDVDEVKFSNGQVTVSGTTIQELQNRLEDYYTELRDIIDRALYILETNDDVNLELAKSYADQQMALMKANLLQQIQELLQNHPDIDLSGYVTKEELGAYATKDDLFDDVSELNNEIRTLSETDAALKTAFLNLTSQVVANGQTISDIQKRFDDLSSQIAMNTADISWLKNFYRQLQDNYVEQQATIVSQQQRITSLENYVNELITRMAYLEGKVDAMQQ